jgi:hypothetical protein
LRPQRGARCARAAPRLRFAARPFSRSQFRARNSIDERAEIPNDAAAEIRSGARAKSNSRELAQRGKLQKSQNETPHVKIERCRQV